MRPPRPDIAVPPFPPDAKWVGGAEPPIERVVASAPVLVHFLDFAQLNSVRALPYLRAWSERYEGHGLRMIGVHSPRLPFTRSESAVSEALPRLGVDWPVVVDTELRVWRDYGCRGWPSLFLWGVGGALRWYHLGEGEYEGTEEAIRSALEELAEGVSWPPLVKPRRPGDARDAVVMAPTPELMPGGSLERPWRPGEGQPLSFDYEAAGAYAAATGPGELFAWVDGDPAPPLEVPHPGLYELTSHLRHERHRLELKASGEIAVYSLQFAAGPPPESIS